MEFKLRPWTPNDLEYVARNADNTNITKFMSDSFPNNIEKWKSFLNYATSNKTILYMAIEIYGEAAGGIGISPSKEKDNKEAELGYWLSEKYWGQGIVTGAIKEIVRLAFNTFDIERIYATPFDTNQASHRVLEKSGFKLETRQEGKIIKNGELRDVLVYTMNK